MTLKVNSQRPLNIIKKLYQFENRYMEKIIIKLLNLIISNYIYEM